MRNYGMGDSTPYVKGHPRVKEKGPPCPECRCEHTFRIEVDIEGMPQLRSVKGIGSYLGCPACTWASPMIVVSA